MSEATYENEPALRFPEFFDNWTRAPIMSCLSKVIDYRGKAPPKAEQGVPLITARNVRFGYLDFKEDEYIDGNFFEEWMSRGRPRANDVLFTTEAPLGNVALFPASGIYALGQRIITLQTKTSKCDSRFLFQHLITPNTQRRIQRRGTGSTAKGIKSKLFIKLPIAVPSITEQQKIASFLSAVDERIEKITRKKALLKRYKKGMMQKIFSQEIRFKDNNGNPFPDWEKKELGALTSLITKGTTPTSIGFGFERDGVNFIKAESLDDRYNIIDNKVAKISLECHNFLERSQIENGDILFSIAGTLGRSAIAKEKDIPANTNQAISIIRLKNKRISLFINYFLNSTAIRKRIKQILSVGAQPNLSLEQVRQFEISLPSKIEQQKIADFLSSLNGKIDLVATELQHAQAFKKGLLQQMFV